MLFNPFQQRANSICTYVLVLVIPKSKDVSMPTPTKPCVPYNILLDTPLATMSSYVSPRNEWHTTVPRQDNKAIYFPEAEFPTGLYVVSTPAGS